MAKASVAWPDGRRPRTTSADGVAQAIQVPARNYDSPAALVMEINAGLRGGYARSLYFYENLGLGFTASDLGFPSALNTAGGLKDPASTDRTLGAAPTVAGDLDDVVRTLDQHYGFKV